MEIGYEEDDLISLFSQNMICVKLIRVYLSLIEPFNAWTKLSDKKKQRSLLLLQFSPKPSSRDIFSLGNSSGFAVAKNEQSLRLKKNSKSNIVSYKYLHSKPPHA